MRCHRLYRCLCASFLSAVLVSQGHAASRLSNLKIQATGAAHVPPVEEAFPASTALAEGVSPESLHKLTELVQSFVDDDEVVGAELLVIKNGHAILRQGFGWKDRENQVPMGTGNVFCVRSMTKPVIGTAMLLLESEERLSFSDPVSKYLPHFAGENTGTITLKQLLTHTSGLPMSLIVSKDLKTLEGIQAVADLGANTQLDFAPGTRFGYSDQGTDTLTAIIEVVSGMSAEDYVKSKILEPLGMEESACVMGLDNPLRARGCVAYNGSRGSWSPFWSPEEAPLFPFFLGSQGLYSTLDDYGRFMEFWLKKGRSRTARLLRPHFIRQALKPNALAELGATGFHGLQPTYGQLMQLWVREDPDKGLAKGKVTVFGHSGSDGTFAWVFPEQKAIVLYFTQSRGNTTGLRLEEALGDLFLGVPFDPNQAAPPLDEYLGYYAEDAQSRYQAVIIDDGGLALETPGKRIRQVQYIGQDRWKFRVNPSVVLAFDRDADGNVSGFHLGDHQEFRFEPSDDLPSPEEIQARVASAHHLDLLATIGPLRTHSKLRMEKLGIEGEVSSLLVWPNHFRIDTQANGNEEHLSFDGSSTWSSTQGQAVTELTGPRAATARRESLLAIFGQWEDWFPKFQAIQRVQAGGQDVLIVRMGDTGAAASTLYIDWESGRLRRVDSMPTVEGMGRLGQQSTFGDFREIEGMLLPFSVTSEMAHPLIGTIEVTIEDYELGLEVPPGFFQLQDLR